MAVSDEGTPYAVVVGTYTSRNILFGDSNLTSFGGGDIFLASFDLSTCWMLVYTLICLFAGYGSPRFAAGYGGASSDGAQAIEVDGFAIHFGGVFRSTAITFDETTLHQTGQEGQANGFIVSQKPSNTHHSNY